MHTHSAEVPVSGRNTDVAMTHGSQPPEHSTSAELFDRAQEVLAGGVSRNTLLRSPHPIYVERASGCRVVDVDGVERVDFANNMASLIHGHGHPAIVAAVTEQLASLFDRDPRARARAVGIRKAG